jgi:hypothetical protein
MSPLTVFLAKLLGLCCIILALAMMTRKASTVATITALFGNPPLLLLVEVLCLAGGLAMIIGHNVWSGGPLPIVVTLMGWLMAIRGASLLALSPNATLREFSLWQYEQFFYFYMAGALVLGVYLTLAGFSA